MLVGGDCLASQSARLAAAPSRVSERSTETTLEAAMLEVSSFGRVRNQNNKRKEKKEIANRLQ